MSCNSEQKEYHENNKQLATCAQTPDICRFRKKGSPFVRIVPLALEGSDPVAGRNELVCVLWLRSDEPVGCLWGNCNFCSIFLGPILYHVGVAAVQTLATVVVVADRIVSFLGRGGRIKGERNWASSRYKES